MKNNFKENGKCKEYNKYISAIEKRREINKRRFYRKVKLGILFTSVLIVLAVFCLNTVSFGKSDTDYQLVTVTSGDTLWSIAKSTSGNKDIRELIYEIRTINDIEDDIHPGDVIKVPN